MSGGFWWHFQNHEFWGAEPDYIYHPDDDFEPAKETDYPGKLHAQREYFPQATPFHDWKASKFDMKQSDLTGSLWDKYNTISMPILNHELFLLDVSRAANDADSREEFETKMKQRRTERVEEALRCLELATTIYHTRHIHEIFDTQFGAEADETQRWKAGFDLFLQHKDISSLAMMFGNLGRIAEKAQQRALQEDEERRRQMEQDTRSDQSKASRSPSPVPEAQHWHPTDHELWWDERMWRAERAKQWREKYAAENAEEGSPDIRGRGDLPMAPLKTTGTKHADPPTPRSESPTSSSASEPTAPSSLPKKPASPPTMPTPPTIDLEPILRGASDITRQPPCRKRPRCGIDDGDDGPLDGGNEGLNQTFKKQRGNWDGTSSRLDAPVL